MKKKKKIVIIVDHESLKDQHYVQFCKNALNEGIEVFIYFLDGEVITCEEYDLLELLKYGIRVITPQILTTKPLKKSVDTRIYTGVIKNEFIMESELGMDVKYIKGSDLPL